MVSSGTGGRGFSFCSLRGNVFVFSKTGIHVRFILSVSSDLLKFSLCGMDFYSLEVQSGVVIRFLGQYLCVFKFYLMVLFF